MKNSILFFTLSLLLASCSGNSSKKAENTDICALWSIDKISVNDSTVISPDARPTILFDNSGAYVIQTNCNTIAGSYTLQGDSLKIMGGLRTEMACDDMRAEDMIVEVLPKIETVATESNHTLRLTTGNPDCYLVISKAAE
jgi:META domain